MYADNLCRLEIVVQLLRVVNCDLNEFDDVLKVRQPLGLELVNELIPLLVEFSIFSERLEHFYFLAGFARLQLF